MYICMVYLHLEVDDESKILQTVSTHWGTYVMSHLPFDIKTAKLIPKGYEWCLDELEGTTAYFIDIVIQGPTIKNNAMNNFSSVL